MSVMTMIDPRDLEDICVEFMLKKVVILEGKLLLKNERDILALDGKGCNNSGRKSSKEGEIKNIQAMSAYSNKYDMCLAT